MKAVGSNLSKVLKYGKPRSLKRGRKRRIYNHYQGSSVKNTSLRDGYRLSPGETSQLMFSLSRSEKNSRRKKWLLSLFVVILISLLFVHFASALN